MKIVMADIGIPFDGERFRLYTMHERVDLHWGERPAR